MPKLEKQRILITGGSTGIGAVIAQTVAAAGASVIVTGRTEKLVSETVAALPGSGHSGLSFDVSEEEAWLKHQSDLADVTGLVTAAGILGPIGALDQHEPSDFLYTIKVNLYGTYLAIRTLLPSLRKTKGSVVTFSGGGATAPLAYFDSYAASKAGVVRLTENLAISLADDDIRVNAIAPGFVATRMHEETLAAGPERVGSSYYQKTVDTKNAGGVPPTKAADLAAFLLSSDSQGITGKLISAPWDPWQNKDFQERLRSDSDFATLRRIDDVFFTSTDEVKQ